MTNTKKEQHLRKLGLAQEDWYYISKKGKDNTLVIYRHGIDKLIEKFKIVTGIVSLSICDTGAAVSVSAVGTTPSGKKNLVANDASEARESNSRYNRYTDVAVARARSKAVRRLLGITWKGVFGEEESDEFKQSSQTTKAADRAFKELEEMSKS